MSSAPAACSCPVATAWPLVHAPQHDSAVGCASGHRGDEDRPWKCESWEEQEEQAVEEAEEGGRKQGSAVAGVEGGWGCPEWRSEGLGGMRWKKKRRRKMSQFGTYR